MIKSLLHKIVAIPFVYDFVQFAVGGDYVRHRLQQSLTLDKPDPLVFDVGGGTGLNRRLFPTQAKYICLDSDMQKLSGTEPRHGDVVQVMGSGIAIPQQSNTCDVVICTAVLHHIPDALIHQLFSEMMRILKPQGQLVIMDPVWAPERYVGRLLWFYDRGSYPRTIDCLQAYLAQYATIHHWEVFAVLHRYIIGIAHKD